MDKPDEAHLARQIKALKKDRAYSRAIRDGLRLLLSLMAGESDLLYDMFPDLRADTELQIERAVNERLVQALAGQSQPAPRPTVKVTVEPDADIELEIKQVESDGTESASNFLDSAFGLLQ